MRILVVDDDPDIQVYLVSLLEDHGYDVEAAGSTHDALEMLTRFDADVALLDVMMPGRSGLDLLVRIRTDPGLSSLAVVMVTGHDGALEDEFRSYLDSHQGIRGPDGVIGKPVDTPRLLDTIARLGQDARRRRLA